MTSFRWTRGICTAGLSLEVQNSYRCLNLLVIFKEKTKHFPSFFSEHNMNFICYSNALCIQIDKFAIKGPA